MALKQFFDPKKGIVISAKEAPAGTTPYDPSMGTSLSKLRESVGYNESLKKGLAEQQSKQLQKNLQAAQRKGFSTKQLTGFREGTLDPATATPEKPSVDVSKLSVAKAPTEQPKQTIQEQIKEAKVNKAVEGFKKAYEQTSGRLGQEKASLTPRFLKERRGLETEAAMAGRRGEVARATGGLGQAGAVGQSQLGLDVAKMGAIGSLAEQKQALTADIERRQSEAQLLRDQGIATAQSDAEIALLTQQLRDLESAETQTRQDTLATLGAYGADYQARINELQNDGDPSNDWVIPFLQTARQEKIQTQGLDPITGQPLQTGIQYTVPQALEAYRLGIRSPEVMAALSEGGLITAPTGGGGGGVATPEITDAQVLTNMSAIRGMLDTAGLTGQQAINYLSSNSQGLINKFGREAFDAMTNELFQGMQPVDPVEPPPVEELPRDVQNILEAQYTTTDTKGKMIVNNDAMYEAVNALYESGNISEAQARRAIGLYSLTKPVPLVPGGVYIPSQYE